MNIKNWKIWLVVLLLASVSIVVYSLAAFNTPEDTVMRFAVYYNSGDFNGIKNISAGKFLQAVTAGEDYYKRECIERNDLELCDWKINIDINHHNEYINSSYSIVLTNLTMDYRNIISSREYTFYLEKIGNEWKIFDVVDNAKNTWGRAFISTPGDISIKSEIQECVENKQKIYHSENYIPGEVIVEFDINSEKEDIMVLLESYGLNHKEIRFRETYIYTVINVPEGEELEWMCELEKNDIVISSDVNWIMELF